MSGKTFLERLQSADDRVKRRWLVISTLCVMAVVVFLWVKYFELTIRMAPVVPESNPEAHGFSPWETARNGSAFLMDKLIGLGRAAGSFLFGSKDILIEP